MSLRDASPSLVRDGARDLRTTAARLGLAAWAAGAQQEPVRRGWWGGNGQRWAARDGVLVQALREVEARLRSLAGLGEAYADELERLQCALRETDEQLLAVRVRQDRAEHAWRTADPGTRGPRPDTGGAVDDLLARARALEAEAEEVGHRFALQVLRLTESVPRVDRVRTVLLQVHLHGYAVPASLGTLGNAPHDLWRGRSLVPGPLREPLKRFDRRFGPTRTLVNLDTIANGSNGGVRGAFDKGMAVADIVATGAVYGVASGSSRRVLVATGVVTAAYTVSTWAWDHGPGRPVRPRRPPRVPRPTAGPRRPATLLPPAGGRAPALGPVAAAGPSSTPGFAPVRPRAPRRPLVGPLSR